jgi:hypothetical protein
MEYVMTRRRSSTGSRIQNGSRPRWLLHPTNTNPSTVIHMAEGVAQPALQQVGRPLSLIPVGLYVH